MTADPPEATSRPHLSLVSPPPRPERGGGGHGLPVAAPAPVRVVSAAPDPLQAHGGGHRLEPRPVPVTPRSDDSTETDTDRVVTPVFGGTTSPSEDDAADPNRGGPADPNRSGATDPTGGGAASPQTASAAEPETGRTATATTPGEAGPDTGGPVEPGTGAEPHEGDIAGPDLDTGPGDETSLVEAAGPSSVPNEEEERGPEKASDPPEWHGIVLVTGTDTEVGKTIATAAMAAAAQAAGLRVAVIKPGQTGIATGAPTDADVVTRLAAPDTVRTLSEYPEPLAPLAAAKVAGLPPLDLYDVVDAVRAEAAKHDLVLVEGAGGLLVPMGLRPSGEAWTFADLATTLGAGTIVVSRAGLGTLNHTALTLEALDRRGVHAKVILGAWPAEPELVHWANLGELVPHLVGALPAGAGSMDPGVFRRSAPGWLTPALHGVLDNWRVWAEEAG
ncbi:hypothetical protein Q0Z83_102040 [Actinoplanes sichuanensis]|nr:hypothetical protein Q0Z83_102040 [Actinoplanes sichuanensis]